MNCRLKWCAHPTHTCAHTHTCGMTHAHAHTRTPLLSLSSLSLSLSLSHTHTQINAQTHTHALIHILSLSLSLSLSVVRFCPGTTAVRVRACVVQCACGSWIHCSSGVLLDRINTARLVNEELITGTSSFSPSEPSEPRSDESNTCREHHA